MDAVPYTFVDSVVELFDGEYTLDPLAREVQNPLWKEVVDFHHLNREYYLVEFQMTEKSMSFIAQRKGYALRSQRKIYGDLEFIRRNKRFARISSFSDTTDFLELEEFKDAKQLKIAEAVRLLESLAPQFEQRSCRISSYLNVASQELVLSLFLNKVNVGDIKICYFGQIAHDFLQTQITYSPSLKYVWLSGARWPPSVLPLITTFCFKGKPGKHVSVSISNTYYPLIDFNFVQTFFYHWKANANLNFTFSFHSGGMDLEQQRVLLFKGQVTQIRPNEHRSLLRHETEKSIAVIHLRSREISLEFYCCECDRSSQCLLKERYPDFHEFYEERRQNRKMVPLATSRKSMCLLM
uniref:FTH domain-containing protein n=1 Tax=Steinernema glaseri TaxID=37863 RepID=A0A1I7ZY72_9BILA